MGAVIAIVVALALLGSVLWLKPSPAQRRQAELRELARQLGVDVRLASLPQTRRAMVRKQAADSGVVYRLLRFDIKVPLPRDYVLVRENVGAPWEPRTDDVLPATVQQAIEAVLSGLPRDCVAVELTPHGPGIYWRERGDAQTVRDLASSLERLMQGLSAG